MAHFAARAVEQATPEGGRRGHVVVAAPMVAADVGLALGVVELRAVGGHRHDHVVAAMSWALATAMAASALHDDE